MIFITAPLVISIDLIYDYYNPSIPLNIYLTIIMVNRLVQWFITAAWFTTGPYTFNIFQIKPIVLQNKMLVDTPNIISSLRGSAYDLVLVHNWAPLC